MASLRQCVFRVWIAILLWSSFVSAAEGLPRIPDLVDRVKGLAPLVQEQLRKAYVETRKNPSTAQAAGELGMILHAYEQYELAEPCYQRARALHSESFEWTYYLALIQAELGQDDLAVSTLRKAIALRGGYVPARMKLGRLLQNVGAWDESRRIYQALLEEMPELAEAHYGLGRFYSERGQLAAAIKSFQQACRLFPEFGVAHYALGMAYRNLGETGRSQEHLALFNTFPASRPSADDPLLYAINALKSKASYFFNKGAYLRDRGQLEEASQAFEQVLKENPKFAQAHGNLLSIYTALGQLSRAERHYHSAVELDPSMYKTYYNYGLLLTPQGRLEEAVTAFRQAIEINPYHAESHNNLGYVLARSGQVEDAVQHLRLATEYQPGFPLPHFNLGQILMSQGHHEEAIPHLLKAVKAEDENTARYLYTLAAAYANTDSYGAALYYARQARQEAVSLGQSSLVTEIDRLLRLLDGGVPTNEK